MKIILSFVLLVGVIAASSAPPVSAQTDPAVRTIAVSIEKRKVVGDRTIRVKQGDQVQLQWTTDEKVELHLHGIDKQVEVLPGKTGKMSFTAKATGRFPVTSHGFGKKAGHHHGHAALMYIEVHPK